MPMDVTLCWISGFVLLLLVGKSFRQKQELQVTRRELGNNKLNTPINAGGTNMVPTIPYPPDKPPFGIPKLT